MENEIPNLPEKPSKADRLRSCSRELQGFPIEKPLPLEQWDKITEDLTPDDFDHLKKMAQGHLERAQGAAKDGDSEEAGEEARAAVLLWPRDRAWPRQVLEALKSVGWKGMEAEAFFVLLGRRIGKKAGKRRSRWSIPLIIALVAVAAGAWFALAWGPSVAWGHPVNPVQGPRGMEATFDTEGVKANIQVVQSHMLIFPEATVAELSAWVTFPDQKLEVWEGTVRVLDPQGNPLTSRDVTFYPSSGGPLQPGQGVAVFQQFDAWPWFDRVASFQVTTSKILAEPAKPSARQEMPVEGLGTLSEGYGLKVWINAYQWTDRFASKVQSLSLEFENSGLKAFSDLQFHLRWVSPDGTTLKTLTLRPVSSFRTALPPGGKLGWVQETVFDTEVFHWAPGSEPHPVLELAEWQ